MPSERTPLLARVPVANPRPRYPHNVLRRFCTLALASVLIWFFLALAISATIFPDGHSHHNPSGRWTWPGCRRRKVDYDQLQRILLDTPEAALARQWSSYYTAGAHLAGKNLSQAEWTKDKWEEFGVKSEIVSYDVYINYPVDHRLALLEKSSKAHDDATTWKVSFEASLTEDILDEDPSSSSPDRIPTFHGYSASGNVTGSVVYVNYGTYQDFEDLVRANVSLKGNVAIARYGGIFRGLKVKRAQELGMVGAILYSDPGDDGENTVEKGKKAYPEGPARQPSSVQRGSTQFLSFAPGDPCVVKPPFPLETLTDNLTGQLRDIPPSLMAPASRCTRPSPASPPYPSRTRTPCPSLRPSTATAPRPTTSTSTGPVTRAWGTRASTTTSGPPPTTRS